MELCVKEFDNNKENTIGVGAIYGDNIIFTHRMIGKNARFLSVSGNEIIKSIDDLFQMFKTDSFPFAIIFSSAAYSFILRDRTFDIKKIMEARLKTTPYIMVFPMFENIRILGKNPAVRVYSSNMLTVELDQKMQFVNKYQIPGCGGILKNGCAE